MFARCSGGWGIPAPYVGIDLEILAGPIIRVANLKASTARDSLVLDQGRGWFSFAPDVSDPLVSHRSVDNRVRDRTMAHECLQRPGIDSSTGQGVPSSVAQHVSVDREWQLSGHAKPFN